MSSMLIVSEVNARRMIGWLSESAFTMRGSSASSGNWPVIRPSASRTSLAAWPISVVSENSSVTRLRPNEEDDEMPLMPCTRETAPSMTEVTSRSIVSGEAPSNSVVTETTGWSTCGSSRISTPFQAARPATTINVLTTRAKIGRRMKSAVKPVFPPCPPPG